jgi:D-methionine transport system permease protein
MIEKLLPVASTMWPDFWVATKETLAMTFWGLLISAVLGLILGLILLLTAEDGLTPNKVVYWILDQIVNIGRSIPFVILLVILMPFTRFIVGTGIGTAAVSVPIIVGTIPFIARQVQNALLEINPGVVEAARAMGITTWGIVFRVYLKEGLVSLIRVLNFTAISLVGLTAMAGIVGGGGLGQVAIQKGYQRGQTDVTFTALILTLVIVFATQIIGNLLIRWVSKGRQTK